MITTVATLARARSNWIGLGRDPDLFDIAVTALDSATCHAHVKTLLTSPLYSVTNAGLTNPTRSHVFTIRVNGDIMLDYILNEVPPDADVEILP